MGEKSPLTVELVLRWADAYRRRTGRWPGERPEPIPESPGDNWQGVAACLRRGCRGLPPHGSLARLLAQRRGKPYRDRRRPLSVARVLLWADRHRQRTGGWPTAASGPVQDADGEHWRALNKALVHGFRGLPGGSSLSLLLERYRGVPRWKRRGAAPAVAGAARTSPAGQAGEAG